MTEEQEITQADEQSNSMFDIEATYDPADNKLRFRTPFNQRLEADLYARAKALGFSYAPKQELFFAPAWTPEREDFLLEIAGEIGDEDTTLVGRASSRADRFEDYGEKRGKEADGAYARVEQITQHIPLGQPILVGHHSEKRARRDADRIRDGMNKAINLWKTESYWKERAKAALSHAKYKELPEVRYRRMKGLETDLRKRKKEVKMREALIGLWMNPDKELTWDRARAITNSYDHTSREFPLDKYPRLREDASRYQGMMGLWSALDGIITPEQARDIAVPQHRDIIARSKRWIEHLEQRIMYEGMMLDEAGGLKADGVDFQPGGMVLIGTQWLTIIRVNKKDGVPVSVTTNAPYVRVKGIEVIKEYKPPTEEAANKVKAATKLPPLCNYESDGCLPLTKAEWNDIHKDYRSSDVVEANETMERHRRRSCIRRSRLHTVYIIDEKVKLPAKPQGAAVAAPSVADLPKDTDVDALIEDLEARQPKPLDERAGKMGNLKRSLDAGIEAISVPQLFWTPAPLARQVVREAGFTTTAGLRFLEPSAGSGNIIRAIIDNATGMDCIGKIVAVEINDRMIQELVQQRNLTLYANDANWIIRQGNFLDMTPDDLGLFDAVIMNPPFVNGIDIEHILHALNFRKPKGVVSAICANGPRQNDRLKPLADVWIDLPKESFKDAGTAVSAAICVFKGKGDVKR